MRPLSEEEFRATFADPMSRLGEEAEPPFDFWPYFDALPVEESCGHDFSEGQVDYVYRDASQRFEHVLVRCEDRNVFLVLVLDRAAGAVHGHRVLNLNREYGLAPHGAPEE